VPDELTAVEGVGAIFIDNVEADSPLPEPEN
jgi:hypothetical protein